LKTIIEELETLEDYIKRLHRDEKALCGKFKICKTTKKLYQVGYGSLKYGKNINQFQVKLLDHSMLLLEDISSGISKTEKLCKFNLLNRMKV